MPHSIANGEAGTSIRGKLNGIFGIESGALADPWELTFTIFQRYRTLLVDADILLTVASTGKVSQSTETIVTTGDGSHTLSFPATWIMIGDAFNFDKIQKIDVNYDGTYYMAVITTLATVPFPPELFTGTIEHATDTRLDLVFDIAVDITTAGWTVSASGGAVTVDAVASGSGTTTPKFTLSRSIGATETVTVSYDPGTGATESLLDAELETVTTHAVVNNVYTVDLEVLFTGTSVETGKGTITNPDAANLTMSQNGNLRMVRTTDVAVASSTTNFWRTGGTYTRGAFSMVMNKFTGFTNSIAYYQYRVDANNHISILKLGGQTNAYLRITAAGVDVYTFQSAISITNRFRIRFNAAHEIRFEYHNGTTWVDVDISNPTHTNNIGANGTITSGANSSASDAANDIFIWDDCYGTSKPYPTVTP